MLCYRWYHTQTVKACSYANILNIQALEVLKLLVFSQEHVHLHVL